MLQLWRKGAYSLNVPTHEGQMREQAALVCTEETGLNESFDELGFIDVQESDDGRYDQPGELSVKRVQFCGKHVMFKDEQESSRITDFQSRKKAKQAMWQTQIETQVLDMEDDRDGLVVDRK